MNLYTTSAAICAAALYTFAVFSYGQHVEGLAWAVKVAQMNQAMAEAKAKRDLDVAKLNADLELEHNVRAETLNTKNAELYRLAGDIDRVRAEAKSCSDYAVRPTTRAKVTTPADTRRDTGKVQDVVGQYAQIAALMSQCVSLAEYARVGHAWALGVSK